MKGVPPALLKSGLRSETLNFELAFPLLHPPSCPQYAATISQPCTSPPLVAQALLPMLLRPNPQIKIRSRRRPPTDPLNRSNRPIRHRNLCRHPRIIQKQRNIRRQRPPPATLRQRLQQIRRHPLPLNLFRRRRSQRLRNQPLQLVAPQRATHRRRIRKHNPRRKPQPPLRSHQPRRVLRRIHPALQPQPALARIKRRQLIRPVPCHRHAQRLQHLERPRQIEYRLRSCAHHRNRSPRQFREIGRNIKRLLDTAMHAANSARRKHPNPRARSDQCRRCHRRRPSPPRRDHSRQIRPAYLRYIRRFRQKRQLPSRSPHNKLPVKHGNRSRHRTARPNRRFHPPRRLKIVRLRQPMRDHRRFQRHNRRLISQRRRNFFVNENPLIQINLRVHRPYHLSQIRFSCRRHLAGVFPFDLASI